MIVVNRLDNEAVLEDEGKSEATLGHEAAMRKYGGR